MPTILLISIFWLKDLYTCKIQRYICESSNSENCDMYLRKHVLGWFSHTICAHIVYIPIVIFQKHVNKDIFTCQRRMQWIVQSHPVAPAIHLFSWPKTAWFFFYKALTIEAFRALYNVLHVGKWTKATKETWALPN